MHVSVMALVLLSSILCFFNFKHLFLRKFTFHTVTVNKEG